jgi:glycosyltransferase involved in cell wall biosynthesis
MRFLIISHALHKTKDQQLFSYAPYVREMNLWLNHVDTVEIVAPLVYGAISNIETAYHHENLVLTEVPSLAFTSFTKTFRSLFKLPIIFFKLYKASKKADHIHLRCPGNIGLMGCFVQIFFPKKIKTAKYAGNWDPRAKQPLSYKLQKWLLSNTLLSKNMTVLVYGEWKNQSKNIKPFFTATYSNTERETPHTRNYAGNLNVVFAGTLTEGKRPLLAIQIIEALHQQGKPVFLDMYGDGVLKETLQRYITQQGLEKMVTLHGNQSKNVIKEALKSAHFSILPSKSEGWPKALAESMFFGAIPLATPVSCVPYMLDFGNRGILIEADLQKALATILDALKDAETLKSMSKNASNWSQTYTLDVFETEISKLLKPL